MSRFFLGSKNTHCSQTSVLAGFRTRQTLHSLHIDEEKKKCSVTRHLLGTHHELWDNETSAKAPLYSFHSWGLAHF